MSTLLAPIARAFFEALSPLEDALQDSVRFRLLLRDLGWDAVLEDALLSEIPLASSLPALFAQGRTCLAALDGEDDDAAPAVLELLDIVRDVVAEVKQLEDFSPAETLPSQLRDPAFWAELALMLPGLLLARWLESRKPILYRLLRIAGVIEDDVIDRDGVTFTRRVVVWSRLPKLASDPAETLQAYYGWGRANWQHDRLLEELRLLLIALRRPARLAPVRKSFRDGTLFDRSNPALDDARELVLPLAQNAAGSAWAEIGLLLLPAPATPESPSLSGLYVANLAAGSIAGETALPEGWTLEWSAALDASGVAGVRIDPSGTAFLGVDADTTASLILSTQAAPTILLGAPDGLRLELRGGQLEAVFDATGPEFRVRASAHTANGAPSLALVIDVGDADGLVSTLLGNLNLDVLFGPELSWSSTDGLRFGGSLGLAIDIPIERTLGPVTIHSLALAMVAETGGSSSLTAVATLSAALGPVVLVADGIGVRARLTEADDPAALAHFADVGVNIEFVPPAGFGLSVDAGVAAGGGYLFIDGDAGKYAGVFNMELLGIGISVIGLVETKLPDGRWSLFLALFIDVPSIQLGFGFTLNGVGGLVGINRTLDYEALGAAIRGGALDAVLFPENPIEDAPLIVDQLGAMFPSSDGHYVFGPVIKIGWGTPALIEAQLGIVIALPDPIRIAVLGSISSILPSKEVELVKLKLDVGGAIDMAAGTLAVDASLHDSHIIGFALSGDMALRACFGDKPSFVMALGGFHPGFEDIPAGFPQLDRLSLSISAGSVLDVRFEMYMAITSNTLQCGAAFELSAGVEGFELNGGSDFDALVTLVPFGLETQLGFYISVTAAGVDLMGVWFDASLRGPNPWRVTGTAIFKFLGLEQRIRVDERIGRAKSEPQPDAVDVLGQLAAALALPSAWRIGAGGGAGVIGTAQPTAAGELVVPPDGTLGVAQQVVPLRLTIDKGGPWQIVGGYDRFDLAAGEAGMRSTGELTDWFALSEYAELGAQERLSAPSFDRLRAGIEFGGGDAVAGEARACSLEYRQILRDPELDDDDRLLPVHDFATDPRGIDLAVTASELGAGFAIAADATPIELAAAQFVPVGRLTGAALAGPQSWSASRLSKRGRDPSAVVVPSWEVPA